MALTDILIRNTKPHHKASQARRWWWVAPTRAAECFPLVAATYRFAGKEKMLSLGTYPTVRLKDAHLIRDKTKALLAQGVDPSLARQEEKPIKAMGFANSFEAVARQ